MLSSSTLTRRVGYALLAVAVVGSLAACSSKSLMDNFTAKITAPDFQASGALNGTYSITISGTTINAKITGSDKIKGKDGAMSMTIAADATGSTQAFSTTTDNVDVAGTTYTRTDGGAWSKTADTTSTTITGVIGSIGLTEKDVESHFGQQLHRLDSTKPVPASLLFSDTSGITNPSLTLTFWAKDDGTPAGMTIAATYSQASGSASGDVTMSLDVSFDSLSGVTIDVPSM
jgi:hypothetical protein